MEKNKSHLRILLERVERERLYGTIEDSISAGVALGEFLHNYHEANPEDPCNVAEMLVAESVLTELGLSEMLGDSSEDSEKILDEIIETKANGRVKCISCGRWLTKFISIKRRMGPKCYTKAKENIWGDNATSDKVADRKDFIRTNDRIEVGVKGRLGLRKLSEKFDVSVSVIRRDRREVNKDVNSEESIKEMISDIGNYRDVSKPDFDESIKCPIYKRKGDGTHCKKQCKNSKK